MSDVTRLLAIYVARRKFLNIGAHLLLLSLGYSRSVVASGNSDSKLVDQFQSDFEKYNYKGYLDEINKKISKGGVQGTIHQSPATPSKANADFCRAWGLEEISIADWNTLTIQPLKEKVDGNQIVRATFQLDNGFPVITLLGGAIKVQYCFCTAWARLQSDQWALRAKITCAILASVCCSKGTRWCALFSLMPATSVQSHVWECGWLLMASGFTI
jgi:hypothetical protein